MHSYRSNPPSRNVKPKYARDDRMPQGERLAIDDARRVPKVRRKKVLEEINPPPSEED